MENIDVKLKGLGFEKVGNEWHRVEPGNWIKLVVFFSKSWDVWVLERHKRDRHGKYAMEGQDWTEYTYASDLLEAIE